MISKIFFSVLLAFSLTACGGVATDDPLLEADSPTAGTEENTPKPSNALPIVTTSITESAEVGIEVNLSANVTDPDGDVLQYSWSITSSPVGSAATLIKANQSASIFTPDIEGRYTVQLIVSDGISTVTNTGNIQAAIGNIAPIAKIANLPVTALNSTVQLDGSNSTDPNNDALNYRWTFLSRPTGSQAVFNNAYTAKPSFTADLGGDYQVQLIVSDGEFDSTPATVRAVASAFSITISFPANTDNPPGYTLFIGPNANTVDQAIKVLVRNASDWDPTSPLIELGGDTILNALPSGSTQACFMIRAYNGIGLSAPSAAACEQLP